jgi:Bacterial capsule synthesis protein PGA_cap
MIQKRSTWLRLVTVLAIGFSVVACSPSISLIKSSTNKINSTPTTAGSDHNSLPKQTDQPLPLKQTPIPVIKTNIWISSNLPGGISQSLSQLVGFNLVNDPNQADLRVEIGPNNVVSNWVYALVAPFPTVTDGVASSVLKNYWLNGQDSSLSIRNILVDQTTENVFSEMWGNPDPGIVSILPDDQILAKAWQNMDAWAIIPFDQIEPRWKVLEVDGISPIRKEFKPESYSLSVPISIAEVTPIGKDLFKQLDKESLITSSNRDPNLLTTVIVTGTTALVRGTAHLMEVNGMTYPDQDIRDWLRQADITHVSNEIAFTPTCPAPFTLPNKKLVFCSKPEYIQLLQDLDVKVVELTGDHLSDWGPDAVRYTINLYNQLGMRYYGGGLNLQDGEKPLLLEHNGTKIAFIGCNAKPPGYALASATTPGAVHCDPGYMLPEITSLKEQGYQVITTFQHLEYYSYKANPILVADFEKAAEAGAVIVSGSQAHQPQAMEFDNNSFLHYGLGNLFFDQYNEGFPNRQAFIDRHVFYNGHYINTELLTIMFVDQARSRPMTPSERQDLLTTIFKASNWNIGE